MEFCRTKIMHLVTIFIGFSLCFCITTALASEGTDSSLVESDEETADDIEPVSGLSRDEITADNWTYSMDCAFCHEKEANAVSSLDLIDDAAKDIDDEDDDDTESTLGSNDDTTESKDDSMLGSEDESTESEEESAIDSEDLLVNEPLSSIHAAFGFDCTTCHSDEEAIIDVHESSRNLNKEASRLKKTTVSTETCTSCHDTEDLAEATKDSEALVDSLGTVVNPHDLPVNDSHADIVCTDCHAAHDADASLYISARETCLNCHHMDVYQCHTCHD